MRLLVIGLSLALLAAYVGLMLWKTQRRAAQILFGAAGLIVLLMLGGLFGLLGGI
ncbi:hypothetical protein HUS23_06395 [Ectothiorhodospiraceae bacterium 2226]|nr:hypothetical protein HUS23_06395 [Ectothiorhodospiraceae bacterium 2226]